MLKPGDVVVVDFPGVTGIKRRPAVVVSSDAYHSARPDVILGLITSQVASSIGSTDHALADWSAAGLRLPSLFRSFLVTVPRTAVYHVAGHLSDQDWLAIRETRDRAGSLNEKERLGEARRSGVGFREHHA